MGFVPQLELVFLVELVVMGHELPHVGPSKDELLWVWLVHLWVEAHWVAQRGRMEGMADLYQVSHPRNCICVPMLV